MTSSLFNQMVEAQKRFQEMLLAKANVVGVAIGYKNRLGESTGELSVVTLVETKQPLTALAEEDKIPKELDGAKTDVVEIGRIIAHNNGPRDRWRPTIPGGVSMGHPRVGAGTFGALVKDRASGRPLLLSNNHVFAASNDALIGDPILQPGALDGGAQPSDIVARLERFIPLVYEGDQPAPPPSPAPGPTPPPKSGCDIVDLVVQFANFLAKLNGSEKRVQAVPAPTAKAKSQAAYNQVDAAVARPTGTVAFNDEIRKIGRIAGVRAPQLGMRVRKSGRTTDYTEANITLLNATVTVGYRTAAGEKNARFTGQVITEVMSQPGDSGSLIVEVGGLNAVGLLFAGSAVSTIFTPINTVLEALNITF